MCWMCDQDGRNNLTNEYWANRLGVTTTHFEAASGAKNYTSLLPRDNVGDYKAPLGPQLLVNGLLTDEAGAGIGVAPGNPTITVGAPSIVGTINTIGDEDYFQVVLEAGKTYEIGQFAKVGGAGGIPLADAFFEIYDSTGKLVLQVDGGGPNTPSGLDALSTFKPDASGTYYINARAFDQDGTVNGTKGDAVGDYELFVREAPAGQPGYEPFYDPDSPLHSLDWGSEFRRSSRNPDGDNGTRGEGTPDFNGVTQSDKLFDYRTGIEGKNVIKVYFAKQGDVFLSPDPTTPGLTADITQLFPIEAYEKDAYRLAFQQYENVADLKYVETDNRNEADLIIITYKGTPGPGASLLGRASPPGEESEGQMEFNSGDERYNPAGLTQGGFFFTTLLHEFGHAHGVAHPHDNGGRSSIMRGAGGGTAGIGGAYGDFGLSQGVFTVMSYNDGWDLRPDGTPRPDDSADNGWVGTLSPLDIAVIQDKYGVNEDYNKGDNVYILKDKQETGTFYASIWDGGGTDSIVYDGLKNSTVDLRAATLRYEEGGGGRVSYVTGINGGYTIANGVTIENVRTDGGNDVVNGNAAANRIETKAGDDTVSGGAGDDIIIAGTGFDVITGDEGADLFVFQSGADSFSATDPTKFDRITDFEQGIDKIDLDAFEAANFIGTANFSGQAGQLRFGSFGGDTLIQLDTDGDGDADFNVMLTGNKVLTASDFLGVATGPANQVLTGTAGNDNLVGGAGNDRLIGLAGNDTLNGGAGNDTADYSATTDNFRMELWIASAQNTGRTGSDTLISIENIIGGSGANSFYGSDMNNVMDGGAGNDLLDGRGGDDVLIGGAGRDQLAGRGGNDVFRFDLVRDSAVGANADRITDFTRGSDKIDLSRIDAIAGGADDAFTFIGSGAFSNKAGELRYTSTSAGTVLAGDTNGDGVADFEILLLNKMIPTSADFLL